MARILIVDDKPKNRNLLRTSLACLSHAVMEASGGREALARMRNESFDLVITGLWMPGMNGDELVRAVRDDSTISQPLFIIEHAAGDDAQPAALAQQRGIAAFLTKPAEPAEVLRVVTSVLGALSSTPASHQVCAQEQAGNGKLDIRSTGRDFGALEQLRKLIAQSDSVPLSGLFGALSLLVHDLLSPLGNVMGFSDLLLDERRGPLTPRQKELIHKIHESAEAGVVVLKALRNLREKVQG